MRPPETRTSTRFFYGLHVGEILEHAFREAGTRHADRYESKKQKHLPDALQPPLRSTQ
jgi:hypothetical protein